ncbi:two component, sigma54 specific, Fis family transcriptional regulator [Nitrospirillum viridazoti Y2]|uniref:DNA-binding NtrC family response regulator n=1 Tax=Nitrospirillum amazonense TaxID=28077 RepID=A0A560INK2_9PROT|nr:sigma-54 dependent transcriptional regulator [Nitrospirillum amazonense]EGX99445.1 two component, sigma54 specific, Fis family transcriptional regulator [Nitrospirillum amazonense Y2]TWB60623.1 DNA-binding NtrC family response regulator [Nitrospirillum amazonense]
MATVLIVDDDAALRDALGEVVADCGHTPRFAPSGEVALTMLANDTVDAMILDLRMPGLDGLEVLRRVRTRSPSLPVTLLTAHASAANTIEAMRLGAFDHLTKPVGRAELTRVVRGMLALNEGWAGSGGKPAVQPEGLIGVCEAMRAVQKTIGLLADSDTTVLITGETGTGKEVVARAIHDHGNRAAAPFVAVNCAAIPSELMESELFGHVKGAFTGATADRMGAFRQAAGGTLFLDEIGDMDMALQAKILRALQERTVTPIGGKPLSVNVRVVAATHRDLRQRVREGGFREDLFYRLHVIPIHLPPLRERRADILPLAEAFLAQAGNKALDADAAARLVAHNWPGNVRELRNVVERVAVLVRGPVVTAADIDFLGRSDHPPPAGGPADPPDEDLTSAVAKLETAMIRRALDRCAGNRTEAARLLGIHRPLLYAKMKRYGIEAFEEQTASVSNPDAAKGA